ncbi:MarR family winged helix-turn-helix transcriptional regulator [Agrococcus sp. SGAir0287]|uniref:MarR family winged helix-turn-helix transcriptional regulator n=1 Tax=Agrococcus sp. SGAir0287 TaxID=2070347 RepID=UPI001586D9E0|nr:MarR family transcriptional regulator [Agrococcus sp. SGAir0287]
MSDPSSTDEREAVRDSLDELRHAENRLEQRRAHGQRPSELDRLALRYVVDRAASHEAVTPGGLAAHLGISSPNVTELLKRLVATGVVVTAPHPSDGRSKIIVPVGDADGGETLPAEVRELIGKRTAAEARAIAEFLEDLRDLVDRTDLRD